MLIGQGLERNSCWSFSYWALCVQYLFYNFICMYVNQIRHISSIQNFSSVKGCSDCLLEVKLTYGPVCLLVRWSVSLSVIFPKSALSCTYNAPIRALVFFFYFQLCKVSIYISRFLAEQETRSGIQASKKLGENPGEYMYLRLEFHLSFGVSFFNILLMINLTYYMLFTGTVMQIYIHFWL